ncbi:uncharacterized protein IUM83_00662 [Phytophthora cinnamomi]|uniref:uncharacterized protein n=1 Tax=Phytophthora cinnamomi TaxID=4785 RepID=UPI0035593A84|nr:hypothetical protein IUM83_00662 [Phytophthora cinnamomi]
MATGSALRYNQKHLWEQEQHLNDLRTAVIKEHQTQQARERSIRSMEHALNEEMERVAEEERNLDVRILEITRRRNKLKRFLKRMNKLNVKPYSISEKKS